MAIIVAPPRRSPREAFYPFDSLFKDCSTCFVASYGAEELSRDNGFQPVERFPGKLDGGWWPASDPGGRRNCSDGAACLLRLEDLTEELFRLHDLDNDGLLGEHELIRLNEVITVLHCGRSANLAKVKSKYTELFRSKLDPAGRPIPYRKFRAYAREVVSAVDSDIEAQEMMLEQFVAEAESAREALPFLEETLDDLRGEEDFGDVCDEGPTQEVRSVERLRRSSSSSASSSSLRRAAPRLDATQGPPFVDASRSPLDNISL